MKKIGKNVTTYASQLGYTGKPVIVCDGRVASHGNQCWISFCDNLRKKQKTAGLSHTN